MIRMKHGVRLVAVLAAVAGLAIGYAGAASADPVVNITPNENLPNGTPVTVTGSGYTPNTDLVSVEVEFGPDIPQDETAANLSTVRAVTSDDNGNVPDAGNNAVDFFQNPGGAQCPPTQAQYDNNNRCGWAIVKLDLTEVGAAPFTTDPLTQG
jgi:hypothetical protein